MTRGVSAELSELIDLQRYAKMVNYQPEGRAIRSGNHLSKLRGRGMDFAEVRNYQAGDEIRHMEWRVTARTGRPHIKLYQEERERPVVVLVDFNPSMYFGTRIAFKSVIAARLAALLAWTVTKQGDRVGGLLFSHVGHNEFNPRSRDVGVLPFLAALSHYTHDFPHSKPSPTNKTKLQHGTLSYALQRARRVARPGSILILISDFYNLDEESEKHLTRLQNHNDIMAYHLCDPLEIAPPKPQQYAITDGHKDILLDTTIYSVNQAYQHYCDERIAQLQALFKSLRIRYIQVTAEMDLPFLVRQTFPRKSDYA